MDKKRKKLNKKTSVALVAYLAIMMSLVIGTTLAFLIADTDPLSNTFTPSEVTSEVVETLDGTTKKEVKIKNTGDISAYIRAKVIVTWQDANGNVYGEVPVNEIDYTITFNETGSGNGQWIKASDGFYYWTKPVKSDDDAPDDCYTGVLVDFCQQLKAAPETGYYLNVEIIGSAIQSVPTHVVTSAWSSGVSAVNGTTLQIIQ